MKQYHIIIKSIFSNIVWYWNKEGETFTAYQEQTNNLFWGPGLVYKTDEGYIHRDDVEIISEEELITQ